MLTTVSFAEHGSGTLMTFTATVTSATAEASFYIAGMEEGWRQSLDRLDALVARAGADAGSGAS